MDKGTEEAVKMIVADSNRRVRNDLAKDQAWARKHGGPGKKIGKDGRHAMRVGQAAYMRAMMTEGEEAMHPDSEFMRDMQRRHAHLADPHDFQPRFKNAKLKFRDGKWWRKVDGAWREEASPRRDWSREGAPMLMKK
jgi:hypothetical protein